MQSVRKKRHCEKVRNEKFRNVFNELFRKDNI